MRDSDKKAEDKILEKIKEIGGKALFLTNNSSKSAVSYVEKLEKMGIAATREDFITSSQATAYYLKEHHADQKLYVCGTESLKEELRMEKPSGAIHLSK